MRKVKILIGPHKDKIATVLVIERGAGAKNGWWTVVLDDGTELLFAGEEIIEIDICQAY
jgi:hypothetical protein